MPLTRLIVELSMTSCGRHHAAVSDPGLFEERGRRRTKPLTTLSRPLASCAAVGRAVRILPSASEYHVRWSVAPRIESSCGSRAHVSGLPASRAGRHVAGPGGARVDRDARRSLRVRQPCRRRASPTPSRPAPSGTRRSRRAASRCTSAPSGSRQGPRGPGRAARRRRWCPARRVGASSAGEGTSAGKDTVARQ